MMRRATAADIPEIMRIERSPGYEAFVGQSDAAQHARYQEDEDSAEYVWEQDGRVAAFVVLEKLSTRHAVLLKRIAVATPEKGVGQAVMRAIMDLVFEDTPAHRLELDTSEENLRARHVYEKLGFIHEGRIRDAYKLADGRLVSSDLFSILRPEWEGRRRLRNSENSG